MARVNVDTDLWLDGSRYQSALTSVALRRDVELKDATTFASGGTRANLPGLLTYGVSVAGFWNADMDEVIRGLVGSGDVNFLIKGPTGAQYWVGTAVGGAATLFGAPIGELLAYAVELAAGDPPDMRRAVFIRQRNNSPHGAVKTEQIANPSQYESLRLHGIRREAARQFMVEVQSRATAADAWATHGAAVDIFEGASLTGYAKVPMDIPAGHLAQMAVVAEAGAGSDIITYAAAAALE